MVHLLSGSLRDFAAAAARVSPRFTMEGGGMHDRLSRREVSQPVARTYIGSIPDSRLGRTLSIHPDSHVGGVADESRLRVRVGRSGGTQRWRDGVAGVLPMGA